MNFLDSNIAQVVSEIVERKGFFLIDLILRGTSSKRVIEVFIDSSRDVSAEDCANISREINAELETLPEIGSDYRLDVSSPGVDKPLKFLKQFPKHVNRKFDVSYLSGYETKTLTGKLLRVDGEDLVFSSGNNEIKINFNNIKKAKVVISFS